MWCLCVIYLKHTKKYGQNDLVCRDDGRPQQESEIPSPTHTHTSKDTRSHACEPNLAPPINSFNKPRRAHTQAIGAALCTSADGSGEVPHGRVAGIEHAGERGVAVQDVAGHAAVAHAVPHGEAPAATEHRFGRDAGVPTGCTVEFCGYRQ